MSNLATMRAVLKARIHMDSPYIDGAIGDALRFVRNEELWFNSDKYHFNTIADVWEYELPKDYLNIRGEVYCIPSSSTDSETRYVINRRPLDEVELYRYSSYDRDFGLSNLTSGYPRICGINYAGRSIVIAPQPSEGDDEIFFSYTKDLGTPRYTASVGSSTPPSMSSTFTLLGPDGETLPSGFVNDWFIEGFQLVAARATQYLWSTYHGGTEESQYKAQAAAQEYIEELRRLWGETSDKQSITRVRAYL